MNKLYTPVLRLLLLVSIIAYGIQSSAQVAATDSLTLVRLYNGTGGPSWTTHTNWLITSVPSWYGITVTGNRVTGISLPYDALTGTVTDSLYRLDSLKVLNLSGNALTYFPVLTGLHLDTLNLSSDKLTFRYLIPNKSHVDSFYYAPQDSVDVAEDTTVVEQSGVSFSAAVDNTPLIGDNYQWYKGTTSVVSSTSNVLNSILCMDSSDAGIYYTKITNSQLPALTLYRRAITLRVKRLADPGADFHVCTVNSTLQGTKPTGGNVLWSVVSGGAVLSSDSTPVTAVSGLAIGANVFQYSVTSNNISCPANTYSLALLTVTRDTNPSPANAGADQSLCGNQTTLQGSTPSVGIGTWTVTEGTGIVAQPNSPTSIVSSLSVGENILRWQIVNGACAPAFFDEVKIYQDDTLTTVSAGTDTSICQTSYTLDATLPANANGVWSVTAGEGSFSDATSPVATVSGLAEFANTLHWTVSNTCNRVASDVHVTVYGFTVADAGPDQHVFYSPIDGYMLADTLAVGTGGTGTFTYVWSPSTNLDNPNTAHPLFSTPDSGTYTYSVTVTDGHGCVASDTVTYFVGKSSVLIVPTLFTPNGDGVNDELFIPGIESYPNNELTVVDRNDQIVFKQKNYKNDWKGINVQGFSQVGSQLPADTYYYTLKLEDGLALQKGYFLIKY